MSGPKEVSQQSLFFGGGAWKEKTKRRKDFDRDVEHVKQVALSRVSGTTTKKKWMFTWQ